MGLALFVTQMVWAYFHNNCMHKIYCKKKITLKGENLVLINFHFFKYINKNTLALHSCLGLNLKESYEVHGTKIKSAQEALIR